jgi:hypothetical protein
MPNKALNDELKALKKMFMSGVTIFGRLLVRQQKYQSGGGGIILWVDAYLLVPSMAGQKMHDDLHRTFQKALDDYSGKWNKSVRVTLRDMNGEKLHWIIPQSEATPAPAVEPADCLCYRGHNEDCAKFDPKQALANLQSRIESLSKLIDRDFIVRMGNNGQCYFIAIKHSSQDEEFTGDTLMAALEEFDDWFCECQVME